MTDDRGAHDAVVIERTFDAPVDLVWRMWTEPEHFAKWYGPDGATISVAKMDVRVGGTRLVCMEMQTPEGTMRMWFTGEYRDVVENKRLVYTESMSDEHGNVLSPTETGMPDGHPTTTEVAVELEDIDGRTTDDHDPHRHTRRLSRRRRLDDGLRQARRLHRSSQRPITPVTISRSRRVGSSCPTVRSVGGHRFGVPDDR